MTTSRLDYCQLEQTYYQHHSSSQNYSTTTIDADDYWSLSELLEQPSCVQHDYSSQSGSLHYKLSYELSQSSSLHYDLSYDSSQR